MNENSLKKIDIIFPHKVKKGEIGFDGITKILDIKAFFPRMDTDECISLWAFSEANKYEPSGIARLGVIESQGFKVDKKLSDSGVKLKEYSIFEQALKDEIFFDISSTNLPRRLSRQYMIKNFIIDNDFLNLVIANYKKSRGLTLLKSSDSKTSLDFYNNTVFYANVDPGNEKAGSKGGFEKQFGSVLRAIVIAETVGNQEKYNRVLGNPALAKLLKLQVVLATNSIFKSLGLDIKKNSVAADFKKSYVWGKNIEDIYKALNGIAKVVARTVSSIDLEGSLHKAFAMQEDKKKEVYIKSGSAVDYTSLNQALYDERSRVIDQINKSVTIDDVIRDFGNVEIKKDGSNFKSLCVSPDHDDSNASLKISVSKGVCNCMSCDFSGNIFSVVEKIEKVSFPVAVDLIAEKYSISTNYDYIKGQFKNESTHDMFLKGILNKYKDKITDDEYNKLLRMSVQELKTYEYDKQFEHEKKEVYGIRAKPEAEIESKELVSYIFSSADLHTNPEAEKYIKEHRGLTNYPPELKVLNCKYKDEKGRISSHTVVGFINEKNGVDGKFFSNFNKGRARTFGGKSITVLNKKNLQKENPNFIVSESQWDLVAFYNDKKGANVYENSVSVILNGTGGLEEAKHFINENKGHYSGLILLGQSDARNQVVMTNLVFGTEITKHAHIYYLDEEIDLKEDANDLHKKGIVLSTRFNQSLDVFESDVVAKRVELI